MPSVSSEVWQGPCGDWVERACDRCDGAGFIPVPGEILSRPCSTCGARGMWMEAPGDEPPAWLTSAHHECTEIEATSVHTSRRVDGYLRTVVRWPCTLTVEVSGVEVLTSEYEQLHEVALQMAERRHLEEGL